MRAPVKRIRRRALGGVMSDVLLVVMPFCGVEAPQLSVSLLKGQLRSRGISASVAYLNFPFAEAAGSRPYMALQYQTCAGEWMFSRALFPENHRSNEFLDYLAAKRMCTPEVLAT